MQSSLLPFLLSLIITWATRANAATFYILNRCPNTVWAAAVPGGGRQLDSGQRWNLEVSAGMATARVWGRTGCNFDSNGRGHCDTGDCGGVLECTGYGDLPNTLAAYLLNQFGIDFYDISLAYGFNVPMDFSPTTPTGGSCKGLRCVADINGRCPDELRVGGGCNDPCTTFKTDEYCCNSGSCGPTKG